MTIFPALSFAEQGIYIILATAGQRVKQCIFYSMEEHSFFYYAPKLKPSSNLQQRTQRTKQISDSVFKFLRITALTGCSVLVFGLSYSHLFSQKYAGNVLVEWPGSLLIKLQCLVVFFKVHLFLQPLFLITLITIFDLNRV